MAEANATQRTRDPGVFLHEPIEEAVTFGILKAVGIIVLFLFILAMIVVAIHRMNS